MYKWGRVEGVGCLGGFAGYALWDEVACGLVGKRGAEGCFHAVVGDGCCPRPAFLLPTGVVSSPS